MMKTQSLLTPQPKEETPNGEVLLKNIYKARMQELLKENKALKEELAKFKAEPPIEYEDFI